MKTSSFTACLALAALVTQLSTTGLAADKPAASKAEQALATAAEQQKFAFILFWRENNAATKGAAANLKKAVASRTDKTAWTAVNVADAAERVVVEKFQVDRSPMPLVLAVAPNGAITGVLTETVTEELVEEALVTPCMTRCMKSMQEGKVVLVCLQPNETPALPRGVKEFKADPQFRDRTVIVNLNVADPAEKRFLNDMQVAPASVKSPTVALLAPPGVLVGKFQATVTRNELAQKLHAAGKCCDDPNCKHHK